MPFKQVFVLFGTVCSLSLIALEVSAQQVNCSRFIYSGSKLSHVHNSPSGTFRGSIKIKSVYSCGNATCFDGILDAHPLKESIQGIIYNLSARSKVAILREDTHFKFGLVCADLKSKVLGEINLELVPITVEISQSGETKMLSNIGLAE